MAEPPKRVGNRLEDWRQAERDEADEAPQGAARRMAHKRSAGARQAFHDAEDDEHRRRGDKLPRHEAEDETPEAEAG